MRYSGVLALTLLLGACEAAPEPTGGSDGVADIVLLDGRIYTMDEATPSATGMAVRGGTIVYVGTTEGASSYIGNETRTIDLAGKTVLPGFTDSHAHLPSGGMSLLGLSLIEASSAKDAADMVRQYAEAHPEQSVIVGAGWELSLFKDANPGKDLLDEVVPDRPVFLVAADGHNAWVNSKALEMAGITAETPDPANGRIERGADGEPSGTLRESAQGLMASVLPEVALETVISAIEAGFTYQLSHGITASIDAAIMKDAEEDAYRTLAQRSDLPHRIRLSLLAADEMVTSKVTVENVAETVEGLLARRQTFRDASQGRLDAESVKIFVDGVPENYTAALLEPYIGTPHGPDHAGDINLSENALKDYLVALDKADFQVHMHAIGDRAVQVSLNAIEAAEAASGQRDNRHHISHLEFIDPSDLSRFAPLNATANLQTLWHYEDEYISELTRPFVAEKMHRWIYPAKSFLEAGARVVWGSDWPVSSSDPFDSIEVAVTRASPEDDETPPLNPEEAVSVDDMLRALTVNGAYLMGQEAERGSLTVGKKADFFIASDDPYTVKAAALSEIEVLETFLEGKSVYQR